jgi:hypothetical protein
MRHTEHAYALMTVSPATYAEIRHKLRTQDTQSAGRPWRVPGALLDLHGLVLGEAPPEPDGLPLDPVYLALQAALEEQRQTFRIGTTAARLTVLRGWQRLLDKHIAIVCARKEGP